jgi:hypothetical protein
MKFETRAFVEMPYFIAGQLLIWFLSQIVSKTEHLTGFFTIFLQP